MTATDQPLSIDDILNEPAYGRAWVIGPVIHVDRNQSRCKVEDRTGDTVTVCYRPEDEPAVLAALDQRDEQSLKALGLCEYQPGSTMTRMLQVERLFLISREQAQAPTALDLWHDLAALQTHPGWNDLPSDLAENHDEYIAREISNG